MSSLSDRMASVDMVKKLGTPVSYWREQIACVKEQCRNDPNVEPLLDIDIGNLSILLDAGRPVVFATLELTAQAVVTPARIAAWRALGSGRCLQAACDIQASVPPCARLGGNGAPLHDPCAVAWLIRPDLVTARPCSVRVDLGPGPSRGRTVIDPRGRTGDPLNATVLETLDADGFFALLGQRLANLP